MNRLAVLPLLWLGLASPQTISTVTSPSDRVLINTTHGPRWVDLRAVVEQATPIKNPSGLGFTCPDHATDVAHEVAVVRESDGATVATLQGGDPPQQPNGEVIVTFNIQPVPFGRYRFKARSGGTTAEGPVWSDWSEVSDVWERAPGKLTNLVIK